MRIYYDVNNADINITNNMLSTYFEINFKLILRTVELSQDNYIIGIFYDGNNEAQLVERCMLSKKK